MSYLKTIKACVFNNIKIAAEAVANEIMERIKKNVMPDSLGPDCITFKVQYVNTTNTLNKDSLPLFEEMLRKTLQKRIAPLNEAFNTNVFSVELNQLNENKPQPVSLCIPCGPPSLQGPLHYEVANGQPYSKQMNDWLQRQLNEQRINPVNGGLQTWYGVITVMIGMLPMDFEKWEGSVANPIPI